MIKNQVKINKFFLKSSSKYLKIESFRFHILSTITIIIIMSNPLEQYEDQAFNLMEECPDECKKFMLQLSNENSKLEKENKKLKEENEAVWGKIFELEEEWSKEKKEYTEKLVEQNSLLKQKIKDITREFNCFVQRMHYCCPQKQ